MCKKRSKYVSLFYEVSSSNFVHLETQLQALLNHIVREKILERKGDDNFPFLWIEERIILSDNKDLLKCRWK